MIKAKKKNNLSTSQICEDLCRDYHLGISSMALMKKYARYCKNGERFDERNIFDAKMENLFIGIIEGFSLLDRPLSRQDFFNVVIEKRGLNQPWNPAGWFDNFLNRYKSNVAIKTINAIDENRSSHICFSDFESFASRFDNLLFQYNFSAQNLLNIDETRFSINFNKYKRKGIVSLKKILPTFKVPTVHPCASFVPVVSCEKLVISFLVLPFAFAEDNQIHPYKAIHYTRSSSAPLFIVYTDTGFVNTDSWLFIIRKLGEYLIEIGFLKEKLLIMDNLSMHCSLRSLEQCEKYKIKCLFLPKYSSHITQPLDQLIFANVKKEFKSEMMKKMPMISPQRKICIELSTFLNNIQNVITSETIQASWRNTSLFPWDKEKFLQIGKQSCHLQNDDEKKTLSDHITSMVITVIKNSTASTNQEKQGANKQPEAQEINYFAGKSKKKSASVMDSSGTRKPRLDNKQRVSNKTGMKSNEFNKTRMKSNEFKKICNCQFHDSSKTNDQQCENAWETCNSCRIFSMCQDCYNRYPEILIGHDDLCKSIIQKNKAKKRKI